MSAVAPTPVIVDAPVAPAVAIIREDTDRLLASFETMLAALVVQGAPGIVTALSVSTYQALKTNEFVVTVVTEAASGVVSFCTAVQRPVNDTSSGLVGLTPVSDPIQ